MRHIKIFFIVMLCAIINNLALAEEENSCENKMSFILIE